MPLRLTKLRVSLQQYMFQIIGKSGKDIPVVDARSCVYLPDTHKELLSNAKQCDIFATDIKSMASFHDRKHQELVEATGKHKVLQKLA